MSAASADSRERAPLALHILKDPRERALRVLVVGLVFLAIVLPFVLADPNHSDFALHRAADGGPPGPSFAHPLGVDSIHRDELARLATGARVSLSIALGSSLFGTVLGTFVGIVSASLRRSRAAFLDRALVYVIDGLLALPFILFVASVGVAVGHDNIGTISAVLGFTASGGVARVIRAKALAVLDRDFVVAARALGAGFLRIATRHVFPNVVTTATVLGTNLVAVMIVGEAVLSYLAVGVEPPRPSWGRMIHEAEPYLSSRPLLIAAPALGIVLAMSTFHHLGEALGRAFDTARSDALPKRLPLDVLVPVSIAAAALVLPAPHLSAPIAAQKSGPKRGGELHVASYLSVRTLDPALARDEVSLAISRHVFGRLLTWSRSGEIAPELASSYTWSEDRQALTVEIAPGTRFQDGSALTAADVKRSIERALHPKSACAEASLYSAIEGFDAWRAGKASGLDGLVVTTPSTIVFRLSHPSASFVSLLTLGFVAPVCPSTSSIADPRAPDAPCGAGPYEVASFDPEDHIRLVRSRMSPPDGPPYLDAIEWQLNVRPTSQRYRFERGELDWIRDLAAADAGAYAQDPRFEGLRAWAEGTNTDGIFLNTELPPFNLRSMRRAVALAIDPSVFDDLRPNIRSVAQIVPEALPGAPHMGALRHTDIEGALQAMDDAGYPYDPIRDVGGYPEEIPYVTVPDSFEQFAAEVYREQLAHVGIRIRLELAPFQAYQAEVSRRGAARMGWASWGADFPDPSNFFDPMLKSSEIGELSQNYAFFASPTLDELIRKSDDMPPGAERTRLFEDAERLVADEAPWIPTHGVKNLEVWQPRLLGYEPNPLEPLDFTHAWLGGAR